VSWPWSIAGVPTVSSPILHGGNQVNLDI
jgi:hypothetical protein